MRAWSESAATLRMPRLQGHCRVPVASLIAAAATASGPAMAAFVQCKPCTQQPLAAAPKLQVHILCTTDIVAGAVQDPFSVPSTPVAHT